ncbi:MAG: hypothetical protein ABIS17_02940 [Casimicrobiaceae bacterium]
MLAPHTLARSNTSLRPEPPDANEIAGLMRSGRVLLDDARNAANSLAGRFELAYNAAHALSLAALRLRGCRPVNRYAVFQALPHTLGLGPATWQVLAKAHELRNVAESAGALEVDAGLVADLITACGTVAVRLEAQFAARLVRGWQERGADDRSVARKRTAAIPGTP